MAGQKIQSARFWLSKAITWHDYLFSSPPSALVRQLCNLMRTSEEKLVVQMMDVQEQIGSDDCGLFAIANALSLCCGQDPCKITFRQDQMRQHLQDCLTSKKLTSFPCTPAERNVSDNVKETFMFPVLCSCRMLEDAKGMAQCAICLEQKPRHVFSKRVPWHCSACK